MTKRRILARVDLAVLACLALISPARAQTELDLDDAQKLEERQILELRWIGIPPERVSQLESELRTRIHTPLRADRVSEDIDRLWRVNKLRVSVDAEAVGDDAVILRLYVEATRVLDHLRLEGFEALKEPDLLRVLGITPGGKLIYEDAPRLAERLHEHYVEQGYAWAEVSFHVDDATSTLVFTIYEGPRVFVRSLRFHGQKSFAPSSLLGLGLSLRDAIVLTPPLIQWPIRFGGAYFNERRLNEDRISLERFYRTQGFRDCEVAVDMQRSRDGQWVDLDFYIDEGARYVLREILIEGNVEVASSELRALLRSAVGAPVLDSALAEDLQRIVDTYGRRGYPMHFGLEGRFDVQSEEIFHEDRSITVVFRIHEGPQRTIRSVAVRNNSKTRRPVILRELLLEPGQIADADLIGRSIARLESLRYFQEPDGYPAVFYELEPVPGEPGLVDWIIDLKEDRTGRFNIGGGYSTDVGPFLTFTWANNNFGLTRWPESVWTAFPELFSGRAFSGDGQSLVFEASPGLEVTRYSIGFQEPDLFGLYKNPIGLDLSIYKTLRAWETHLEERTGITASLTKELSREVQVGLGMRDDLINVSNLNPRAFESIASLEGNSRVRGIGARAVYTDLDHPVEPHAGWIFSLDGFLSSELLGSDFDYTSAVANAFHFIHLSHDERGRDEVLRLSASFGTADGHGDTTEVPYFDRFFLGGLDSLRGFDIRGVGPVENGLPRGGEAIWTAGIEYQFPLFSSLQPRRVDEFEWMRGVAFLDFGGLGLDWNDPTAREVRASAGVGVRMRMPFLPSVTLELNLSVPWLLQETDDTTYFQFRLIG